MQQIWGMAEARRAREVETGGEQGSSTRVQKSVSDSRGGRRRRRRRDICRLLSRLDRVRREGGDERSELCARRGRALRRRGCGGGAKVLQMKVCVLHRTDADTVWDEGSKGKGHGVGFWARWVSRCKLIAARATPLLQNASRRSPQELVPQRCPASLAALRGVEF